MNMNSLFLEHLYEDIKSVLTMGALTCAYQSHKFLNLFTISGLALDQLRVNSGENILVA